MIIMYRFYLTYNDHKIHIIDYLINLYRFYLAIILDLGHLDLTTFLGDPIAPLWFITIEIKT